MKLTSNLSDIQQNLENASSKIEAEKAIKDFWLAINEFKKCGLDLGDDLFNLLLDRVKLLESRYDVN